MGGLLIVLTHRNKAKFLALLGKPNVGISLKALFWTPARNQRLGWHDSFHLD